MFSSNEKLAMIARPRETPLTARSLDDVLAFKTPLHREICFSRMRRGGRQDREDTISDPERRFHVIRWLLVLGESRLSNAR